MWALGAGGAIALLVWRGWSWGAGWVMGTAVSALNFRWLKQLTEALGGEAAKPRKAVFLRECATCCWAGAPMLY